MEKIIEYLERIEKVQGTGRKRELVTELISNDEHAEEFFRLVYSKAVYGVSSRTFEKVIESDESFLKLNQFEDAGLMMSEYNKGEITGFVFEGLKSLLEEIASKSGYNLQEYLCIMLKGLSPGYSKWITRLILKNLRIGITENTINKVFKELDLHEIEKFGVMLCGSIREIEEYEGGFPCYAGIKYDGMRCVLEKLGDKITMTARSGKNIDFFPEIEEELLKYKFDFIIDGEIMGNIFNDIQKRIGRKRDNIEIVPGLHFRMFDITSIKGIPVAHFRQDNRYQQIDRHFKESELLKFEEKVILNNQKELKDFYKLAYDRDEEGIIIKHLSASYEIDGRKSWIKVKPVFENSFEVIGFTEGRGKHVGKIGALLVTDKTKNIESKVGSGIDDYNRDVFTKMMDKNELVGIIIDVKYNEITVNSKEKNSLRNPRFLKIRDDKTVADMI